MVSTRTRPARRSPHQLDSVDPVDVAIIGFGFAGLATLAHLGASGLSLSVAVIADDPRGVGVAYATGEPRHLLNVRARQMGLWAHAPGDFARWLGSDAAARACARLGVGVPGPDDLAPRALYGAYLTAARSEMMADAARSGLDLRMATGRAEALRRAGDGSWEISVGPRRIRAHTVVLATGNEARALPPALRDVAGPPPSGRDRDGVPVMLVGTGLTAVDALLSLRSAGFVGPVVAVSRSGLLPRAHRRDAAETAFSPDTIDRLTSVSAVVRLLRDAADRGDWRAGVDGLRPHSSAIWQRLPREQQLSVMRRWGSRWSVHRHRMAPDNAATVEAELRAGTLRVVRIASVDGERAPDGGVAVTLTHPDRRLERLEVGRVINCTGAQTDVTSSAQPLLRGLVADGIVTPHHTGVGLAADDRLQVAERVHALGTLLIGQRWESIAVPELREQAAAVAGTVASGPPDSRPRRRRRAPSPVLIPH